MGCASMGRASSSRANVGRASVGRASVGRSKRTRAVVQTRGWVSIQCKCNIFQYPRLPTPAAGAPWTGAANRLEHYNDARAVVVLLKTRVKSEQTLPCTAFQNPPPDPG